MHANFEDSILTFEVNEDSSMHKKLQNSNSRCHLVNSAKDIWFYTVQISYPLAVNVFKNVGTYEKQAPLTSERSRLWAPNQFVDNLNNKFNPACFWAGK